MTIQLTQRFSNVLCSLADSGYIIKTQPKTLTGGINSSVFKIETIDSRKFALKLYKYPSDSDPRQRRLTEKKFLDIANLHKITNVPSLLHTNKELNYSLLTWISGENISTLTNSDVSQIAQFIINLNEKIPQESIQSMPLASESVIHVSDLKSSILRRFNTIKAVTVKTDLDLTVNQWIENVFQPVMIQEFMLVDDQKQQSIWDNSHHPRSYISPSDVGIHNSILFRNRLYFFDFEYSGRDDLSKLIADWVLQPNYPFTKEQEQLLLGQICDAFSPSTSDLFLLRYFSIKRLIALKWILIMLRTYNEGCLTLAQWQRVTNYADLILLNDG